MTLGSTGLIGLVDTRESNLKRSKDFEVFEKGNAKTISVHPIKKHLVLCPNNRGACGIFDIRYNLGACKYSWGSISERPKTESIWKASFKKFGFRMVQI